MSMENAKSRKFGIEIEMTGITREQAAKVLKQRFGGRVEHGRHLDEHIVTDEFGRSWKVCSDSSIRCERKQGASRISAGRDYAVELVSPILTYANDMELLQDIVRDLRHAGAVANASCGIHIHLDGADHDARSIRNFVSIIASHDDLLYSSLRIHESRANYCKRTNRRLVDALASSRTRSITDIERIWYGVLGGSNRTHYDNSRYHILNLHSLWQRGGNRTVELRCFNADDGNGKLHAGLIRSYVALAIAINEMALTQRCASAKPCQTANQKYAMRTWMNRLGLIGDEWKACREHLVKHLAGNAAWRNLAA